MNKSTRDGFGDALLEYGHMDDLIVLDADLSSATRTNKFAQQYPDKFIQCGISEMNMIGISAGLAQNGFRPIISSFGAFITGRYDQIRCSLAYPDLPVIIVGTHAGIAIGRDGPTQMGLEDINLMRGLPNMEIYQPATYNEAKEITKFLLTREEPKLSYLRLGRQEVEELFPDNYVFYKTQIQFMSGGIFNKEIVIFNSGCLLKQCVEVSRMLKAKNIKCALVNVPVLKPLDEQIHIELKNYNLAVTVEDHSTIGGLGSIISEEIAKINRPNMPRLLKIGIDNSFTESGKSEDLYEKYGLTSSKILERIYNEYKQQN
jgi:transketolase